MVDKSSREDPPAGSDDEAMEYIDPDAFDGAEEPMEDEDGDEEAPPKKKARGPRGTKPKPSWLLPVDAEEAEERGLRRGSRQRYAPLAHWRLEKVVYGRPNNGKSIVPVVKEIVRVPDSPIRTVPRTKPTRKGAAAQKKKKKQKKEADSDDEVVRDATPDEERGLDEATDPNGDVRDYVTGEIAKRRVAFTGAMVNPKLTAREDFMFQKIFGDADFFAAGQLHIPPGKKKPVKITGDNTYVFYVIQGAVLFQVHQTEYMLATGSQFMAPRGNYYLIKNIGKRPAKLFFAQARKLKPETDVAPAEPAPATPGRASSAPGAPSSEHRVRG